MYSLLPETFRTKIKLLSNALNFPVVLSGNVTTTSWVFSKGMLGCWSHDQLPKMVKMKVVALHRSFLNLVELCSEVLPLWRYDVKDFESAVFFFFFGIFEVLSVPPLFLLDSSHSCGFRWNSGGIYQPKFHSCHEIVQFRYLHRNGPRSPVTGMAPESSDRN